MGSSPRGRSELEGADINFAELTDKVTVATKAQKKLRHMVLMLNTLLISWRAGISGCSYADNSDQSLASMEKRTPPMGDPKATATPAALEAVRISRIFTVQEQRQGN